MKNGDIGFWVRLPRWGLVKATQKKSVVVGRICSSCLCAVLSKVEVEASVTRNFRWYGLYFGEERDQLNKTEQQAHVVTAELLREIDVCRRDRTVISRRPHPKEGYSGNIWTPYDFRRRQFSSMAGINDPCPNCGNVEPWMPEVMSERSLADLQEENFPHIFESYSDACAWVQEKIRKTVDGIRVIRQSVAAVEQAHRELPELFSDMQRLTDRRSNLPECAEKSGLEQKRTELLEQRRKCGIFRFAERKACKDALKLTQYYLEKAEEKLRLAQKPVDKDLACLRVNLQKTLRIAYGCTDGVLCRKLADSIAFHPGMPEPCKAAFGDWEEEEENLLKTGGEEKLEDVTYFPMPIASEETQKTIWKTIGNALLLVGIILLNMNAATRMILAVSVLLQGSAVTNVLFDLGYLFAAGGVDYFYIRKWQKEKKRTG